MLENSIGLVPLQAYLIVAAFLFCTGVWGLINSRNAVRVLMSIELMLNAVNILSLIHISEPTRPY